MDSRTAAHTLAQIAELLEMHGENKFKSRAYRSAAKAILSLDEEDLAPLVANGELKKVAGIGPATLSVITDLVETGESRYLNTLRGEMPEGMIDMLRIPGLGMSKIQLIHETIGVDTVEELEEAARDGRLAKVKGIGPKTAEKILRDIELMRQSVTMSLYAQAAAEGERMLASVRKHPDIVRAELAGSLRRRREVIADIDIVAACSAPPASVAASFTRVRGVKEVFGSGASISIKYVDGSVLDLKCVTEDDFAVAWWRATGSTEHLEECTAALEAKKLRLEGDRIVNARGRAIPIATEEDLYKAFGMQWIAPELREGQGETKSAAANELPTLLEYADIRGVLHCHSQYSDGTATIEEMAAGAKARGWSYIGITDHSQAAFYAGGLKPDQVLRQHDEIDRLNRTMKDFRILKGIEADILAEGRVDYEPDLLERFDYVIGSVHGRFKMNGDQMTARVLGALDDPYMTILGHPTGRLLLSRDPYALDIDAVLDRAKENGVAVELNADPHRLDLDWRYLKRAKDRGVTIEIGPDAHSVSNLDFMRNGIGIARKGWLEASDILNAREATDVLDFAQKRRAKGTRR